ncbi:MAG: DUF348 domain-containing protein [Eubacterium sp.]|nr:DUF348 domain-containing protein [Eubacterium sp.]
MGKDVKQKKRWSAGKWLLFIAVLLVVLAAVPVVDEFIPRKVTVRYITFNGETEAEYETRAHRVSDFLAEHKYEIADDDMVLDLYETAAMDPTTDDIKASLKSWYMHQTGKWGKEESLVPFAQGFERTAGSMRDTDPAGYDTSYDRSVDGGGEADEEAAETLKQKQNSGADAFISNGMTIRIKKAESAAAKIGGEKVDIMMYPGNVEDTLGYNGIEWDEDDVIEPELDKELDFDDRIKITRVKIVVKEKKETIEPVEKGAVFDKGIASGTIVRTEGKPGKAVYKYTYKYINGKKKKTKKEFDHWIRKPTDIQLKFGTSVTGETGAVEFGETFIGNCTAYYFGNNAHGATGGHCHYGTCAVDPKVIPYGTKLYVEGYGTAVANDCGGAVKGHIIDLYMRSTKECFSWGRRNRKVYVLK